MKSNSFADFALSKDEIGKHAVGHGLVLTLEGDGEIFHRRCIKRVLDGGDDYRDSILVAEIDGVHVYVKPPGHIIVTKRDLKL